MGVYSIDSITIYINFYEIIKKKKMENILFQILILINAINQACNGGVLWKFIREKTYYYVIVLDWKV